MKKSELKQLIKEVIKESTLSDSFDIQQLKRVLQSYDEIDDSDLLTINVNSKNETSGWLVIDKKQLEEIMKILK